MTRPFTLVVVCLAVAAAVGTAPLAVDGHETPPPAPQLEPNDEFHLATEIEPRTLHGLAAIPYTNATGQPALEPSAYWEVWDEDEDVYAVELERGEPLPVTLYHYGGDGNLEYTLYDPSKRSIRTVDPDGNWSRTGSALTRSERAIQRGTTTRYARCTGTHYIEVETDDAGTRAPYRLEVDDRFEHNDDRGDAATLGAGTYGDLMVTTYDPDYYRLDVRKGETIEVTIDLTTQAHWEMAPAPRGVDYDDPITSEEWAPYDHPRWDDVSFKFGAESAGLSGTGDFRYEPVDGVKYGGLHRDKVSLEVTESGTIYIYVRPNSWWTDPIDGAAKWNANSARYTLTITRSGGPPPEPEPSSDAGSSDAVRDAIEGLEADSSAVGLGGSQLAGETVNLRVRGRGTYSFEVTENLAVEDVSGCGRGDAGLRLETDTETIREIGGSKNPGGAIGDAYRDGEIRIEGVGVVNRVKWGVINHVRTAADWVGF